VGAPGGGHGWDRRWLGSWRLGSWLGCWCWRQTHAEGWQGEGRACGQVGHLLDAVKGFYKCTWPACPGQGSPSLKKHCICRMRFE
jgi:hypothetical protein